MPVHRGLTRLLLFVLPALMPAIGCRDEPANSSNKAIVVEKSDSVIRPSAELPPQPAAAGLLDDDDVPDLDGRKQQTAGTRQMAARLASLARRADPEKTPAMRRTRRLAQLRQMLGRESHPHRKLAIRAHIAWQLMLDGQNEAAVKQFQQLENKAIAAKNSLGQSFYRMFVELSGLAYLRLAEQQNCILHHSCQSCIMPITGEGIHQQPDAAGQARQQFAKLLANNPDDWRSRWLLNVACMALGEYPNGVPDKFLIPPEAFASDYEVNRFVDVAQAAGVATIGLSGGVVIEDFNNDGLMDLMTSDWGIDQPLRFFQNRGTGTFAERTLQAGLLGEVGGLNLVHADYDNDGLVDVYVMRGAWLGVHGKYPNSLLRNLGNGRFDDVTGQAGLDGSFPTQAAVWADFDLDGHLDLFVGNESSANHRYPCQLFHNNGDGSFTDIAPIVGVNHEGFVKGVAAGDIDNDGRPDLFLSCFGESNRLYRNQSKRNGTMQFVNVTDSAGVEEPQGSFATWFWDYDNDGWLDLLVAPFSGFNFDGNALKYVVSDYLNLPVEADRIHLYRNLGNGTFENRAPQLGLDQPLLAMGANFGDLDNDGFLDCYFGTGDPHFATIVPNRMFRNDQGRSFQDVTTSGGFGHIQKGHGIGFADMDNDGDQDIFAVMGGAIAGDVYQNVLFANPGHNHHWVTLRLYGVESNRYGVGTRITVMVDSDDGMRPIHRVVGSGGSFGASSLQQEIGLGNAAKIAEIQIRWPASGRVQRFRDLAADSVYTIQEDQEQVVLERWHSFSFPEHHVGHASHPQHDPEHSPLEPSRLP